MKPINFLFLVAFCANETEPKYFQIFYSSKRQRLKFKVQKVFERNKRREIFFFFFFFFFFVFKN
jgi:hypothetical protein